MKLRTPFAALAITAGLIGALAAPMPAFADELEDAQQTVTEETQIVEEATEQVELMVEDPTNQQATEAASRALSVTPSPFDSLLNSGQNAQLIFAQLQMQLAQQNKQQAMEKVEAIREQQDKSRACTELINGLRALKNSYPSSVSELVALAGYLKQLNELSNSGGTLSNQLKNDLKSHGVTKTDDVASAAEATKARQDEIAASIGVTLTEEQRTSVTSASFKGIRIPQSISELASQAEYEFSAPKNAADGYTEEEIDQIIADIEAMQENLGTDIQQQMEFTQDYMGQYNSYVQGAASAVADAQEAQASASRGTIDEADQILAVQSELVSFISERADKIEELKSELENLDPASADAQNVNDQIDAALDELAMGCEALQQAQQGATGTVSGGSGDSFGMIAVGAGAGALVGGGAIYALMRRRASQAEQKA
ncbi:hypothetical protein [Collinsella ihumii]|uniref:LPXTG cell wall anchor domain-containing protein n=1 Tax=Collinsella ihumii TaxID=1720204 RepID=A0AAW7JPS8_9ACTN|nr:hypothetical protein [Collinsella ihumii]MDN0055436.1 hypothetical protein [Collinsella ihumii]MDN0063097.1 hypothetical protein [Collinsella ihumii]MDN0069364.1 hypothetical protein [Collinsella ihumii]